jgi:hypothetical protein
LANCATKSEIVVREDEREVLSKNIKEYWGNIIEGKIDKAYLFELPEFREKVSIIDYLNRFKLFKYTEAELLEIEMKGNEANSTVKVTYRMLLKRLAEKDLTKLEKAVWIKKDSWYHIPEGFEIAKK